MVRVYRFLGDLAAGDPVALIVAGVIASVTLVMLLIWWKIARDLRREDEEMDRRRGRKKEPLTHARGAPHRPDPRHDS